MDRRTKGKLQNICWREAIGISIIYNKSLQRFVQLQKLTSNNHDKTVTCGTVVRADLLRFASLLRVVTTVADMIVVIMPNFIAPTKQMQLFTVYLASQLSIFTALYKKRAETQVYCLPRHIWYQFSSNWRNFIVIPIISSVDRGIEKEI